MTVQLNQYTVIFLISINIGMSKRSFTVLEISFIGRHHFTMHSLISGSIVIGSNI